MNCADLKPFPQRPKRIGQRGSAPSVHNLTLRWLVGQLPQPFTTTQARYALASVLLDRGLHGPSPNFVAMTLGIWVDRGLLTYTQPEWQRLFRRTDQWESGTSYSQGYEPVPKSLNGVL